MRIILSVLMVFCTLWTLNVHSVQADPGIENIILDPDADTLSIDIDAPIEDTHYHPDTNETGSVNADEHEKGGLPQLNTQTFITQLFWLIITFSTLLLLLSKRYLPRISDVMEERRALIQTHLDDAEDYKDQANEAQSNYEALMKGAYDKTETIMQSAQDTIQSKQDAMMKDFRDRADTLMQQTEQDMIAMKKDIMNQIEDIAVQATQVSVQKLIGMDVANDTVAPVVSSVNNEGHA